MATIWETDGYAGGIVEGEGSDSKAGTAARSEEAIINVQSMRECWSGNGWIDVGYVAEYPISYTTHSCASLGMGSASATESESAPKPKSELRPESSESEYELPASDHQ